MTTLPFQNPTEATDWWLEQMKAYDPDLIVNSPPAFANRLLVLWRKFPPEVVRDTILHYPTFIKRNQSLDQTSPHWKGFPDWVQFCDLFTRILWDFQNVGPEVKDPQAVRTTSHETHTERVGGQNSSQATMGTAKKEIVQPEPSLSPSSTSVLGDEPVPRPDWFERFKKNRSVSKGK